MRIQPVVNDIFKYFRDSDVIPPEGTVVHPGLPMNLLDRLVSALTSSGNTPSDDWSLVLYTKCGCTGLSAILSTGDSSREILGIAVDGDVRLFRFSFEFATNSYRFENTKSVPLCYLFQETVEIPEIVNEFPEPPVEFTEKYPSISQFLTGYSNIAWGRSDGTPVECEGYSPSTKPMNREFHKAFIKFDMRSPGSQVYSVISINTGNFWTEIMAVGYRDPDSRIDLLRFDDYSKSFQRIGKISMDTRELTPTNTLFSALLLRCIPSTPTLLPEPEVALTDLEKELVSRTDWAFLNSMILMKGTWSISEGLTGDFEGYDADLKGLLGKSWATKAGRRIMVMLEHHTEGPQLVLKYWYGKSYRNKVLRTVSLRES